MLSFHNRLSHELILTAASGLHIDCFWVFSFGNSKRHFDNDFSMLKADKYSMDYTLD